jgi:ketosteroid isomerase-like protein
MIASRDAGGGKTKSTSAGLNDRQGSLAMTEPVSRSTVDAFYRAYISRDPLQIGATLDDDVEWHVTGPVEVITVCGFWRGKAAVVERYRLQPEAIAVKRIDIEHLLVDGDSSAMFGRITSLLRDSGRVISHRVAHIVRYRNGKVVYFSVMNDSFDAAEQFLGHRLNVHDTSAQADDELLAV